MSIKPEYVSHCTDNAGFAMLLLALVVAGGTVLCLLASVFDYDWFGAGRYRMSPAPLGDSMPTPDNIGEPASLSRPRSLHGQAAIEEWSTSAFRSWRSHGKVTAPRILLARLLERRDMDEVNAYLRRARPWSNPGSNWTFHRGDYDFSLVTLTSLLYLFGHDPERLYPETRAHLLGTLLTESGGTPLVMVPRTGGLILDTENHLLMTEGSRYLKNQWLARYGSAEERADPRYDNRANGLGAWLTAFLDEMIDEGVYEFNSRPYVGYTLQALLNIEAWPEDTVIREKARYLLDIMNLQYALGSLDLRRNPPFRRQYKQAETTRLNGDPHTAFMRVWTSEPYDGVSPTTGAGHYSSFALIAETHPYRLPDDVRRWTLEKPHAYFVRFGRGPSACPELYSGGPGYLLSAGGANRGFRSHIVARTITLLLGDGETDLSGCIHLQGKGGWRVWNNTGVYRRFACANGPAVIPETMEPLAAGAGWRIVQTDDNAPLLIAVYSDDDLSIVALFPDAALDAQSLLATILENNSDPEQLRHRFIWPDGRFLEYDVNAPKGLWIMKSDNGETLDRDYDAWPQINDDAPRLSFARGA